MCDPISLLGGLGSALGGASTLVPLGLGLGTSLVGGAMTRNAQAEQQLEQQRQNVAAENARNQVLQTFLGRQNQYQQQNQQQVQTATDAASADNVGKAQLADTAARTATANSTIDKATDGSAPIAGNAPSVASTDLANRTADRVGVAKTNAANQAALSGFGDTPIGLGLSTTAAARNVDMTNSFASGDAAILPDQQNLAEFAARTSNPVSPMSTTGSAVSGLGNVFASLAGSGKLAGATNSIGNSIKSLYS